jgi:hypothetical protein
MEALSQTDLGENMPEKTNASKHAIVLWAVVALILAVVACTFNSSQVVLRAGFLEKAFAVLGGTVLGTCFAVIGDAIRRYARPDMIMTKSGFFSLISAKLFWQVGPQLIGVFMGVILGVTLVLR